LVQKPDNHQTQNMFYDIFFDEIPHCLISQSTGL